MSTFRVSCSRFAASLIALGALAVVSPVHADAPALDQDAMRISSAGRSLKWNWTPPGRSDRFGHAETLVHAPLSTVKSRLYRGLAALKPEVEQLRQSHAIGGSGR